MNEEHENDEAGYPPDELDRIETAIHEAAHAATAIYFGFPLAGPVSIRGDDRNAGSSKIGKPKGYYGDHPKAYFLTEQEVIVNFAGAEAVKLYRERNHIQTDGGFGDGDDIHQAKRCFDEIEQLFSPEEKQEQFDDRLRKLTGDVVAFAPVDDAIIALANDLLKREELSAAECEALVKKKLGTS